MKRYITTAQAAKILGISTVAVFKKIKNKTLPAQKIGRNYAIDPAALGLKADRVGKDTKKRIEKAVKRVVRDYGETLKKLGKE
ncbi:MAG: helix-turn-helix domain-containing protein [bacterium]